MKLADWLHAHGRTATWLADTLSVHKSTVGRWLGDDSNFRPSWDQLREIVRITNGEVTPNDFLAAPESPDPESPDDDTPQLPPTHSAQPVEVAA